MKLSSYNLTYGRRSIEDAYVIQWIRTSEKRMPDPERPVANFLKNHGLLLFIPSKLFSPRNWAVFPLQMRTVDRSNTAREVPRGLMRMILRRSSSSGSRRYALPKSLMTSLQNSFTEIKLYPRTSVDTRRDNRQQYHRRSSEAPQWWAEGVRLICDQNCSYCTKKTFTGNSFLYVDENLTGNA